MNNSLFNFRDDEEREVFLVAIPVIALFAILGYWLMKNDTPEIEPTALVAVVADADGDGVMDLEDQCINLPGSIASYGCPAKTSWAERDNDNDGLRNGIDSCPQTKGSIDNNGCAEATVAEAEPEAEPAKFLDKDGDGFADSEDACPSVAGDNGSACPADTDSDGVIDRDDNCTSEPGPADNSGCPVNTDNDNDGVLNDVDQCPEEAGSSANNGCPTIDTDGDGFNDPQDRCPAVAGTDDGCPADSDGDGISDSQDRCPQIAGSANKEGCPTDTDGDGVADNIDECPIEVGTAATNGCPVVVSEPAVTSAPAVITAPADTDGDGVPDADDRCPTIGGVAANSGCPNDADGDGIADADDKCPDDAGEISFFGCPVTSAPDEAEVKRVLDAAIDGVEFNSGSAVLTLGSQEILNSVAELMAKYPDTTLEIAGHTDSSGNEDRNMQLSLDRARSCAAYIASQGIGGDRLKAYGYGDSEPRADNSTPAGRQRNRRVEFGLK